MDSRFQRNQHLLMDWAVRQTPVWLRAKIDPADLVQQTLLESLKNPAAIANKSDQQVIAYLRRILANNLIDAIRKYGGTKQHISAELLANSTFHALNWLAANDTSPSERCSRNEQSIRLADCLAALPENQRTVIEMRYFQGTKLCEIALKLDRSEGAVAALLHRAVRTLKSQLHELHF